SSSLNVTFWPPVRAEPHRPNFDSGRDGVAVFPQHHHMTVAVNTFLAKIDPGGFDAGLLLPTFPRWPVLGRLRHNSVESWLGD
ncbi:MAG TPA: hypothetical protein VK479_03250, partial [Micropepsaceae bacterium]|nr:hypothetical protein [Micropepsaceae bacterium]